MKKPNELPLRQILSFAERHYRDLKTSVGVDLFQHGQQVARQAELIRMFG